MRTNLSQNDKAIVSGKGQVVIPINIREKLGIHTGTELIFSIQKNGELVVKPIRRHIEMFFGCCKDSSEKHVKPVDIDQAIAQAVIENDKTMLNDVADY